MTAIGTAGAILSGAVVVGTAGVGLWYLVHLGTGRPVHEPGSPAARFSRRRTARRVVLMVGMMVLAGAFFAGVNFLPDHRTDRASAALFVSYWSAVLLVALVLMILALVDIYVGWRFHRQRERDALVRSFRRRSGADGGTREDGNDDAHRP